ncbi:Ig domain-containing protein [Streptomyces sp. NPDC032472]|uniref:Ig domain-containing protein n=1 Tax=Streptomyces sp. NPDC032472 TaxID=3155018 RepID=UPI0034066E6D
MSRRLAVLALGLTAALALPAGPAAAASPAAVPPAAAVVAAAPAVASPGDQVSYQYDFVRIQVTAATGGTGPYTWSAVNLPTGARIDPASGVISGTLRGAGTRTVTVTATDAGRRLGQRHLHLARHPRRLPALLNHRSVEPRGGRFRQAMRPGTARRTGSWGHRATGQPPAPAAGPAASSSARPG